MSDRTRNVLTYIDAAGDPQCVAGAGCGQVSHEFALSLGSLSGDLGLAADCIQLFGALPLPVAKALRHSLHRARLALEPIIADAGPSAGSEVLQ
jgi:hypothetical protein